jgi:hypothetical protein
LEVLQWLKTNGCPWSENAELDSSAAAMGEHLVVLQWLKSKNPIFHHFRTRIGSETAEERL